MHKRPEENIDAGGTQVAGQGIGIADYIFSFLIHRTICIVMKPKSKTYIFLNILIISLLMINIIEFFIISSVTAADAQNTMQSVPQTAVQDAKTNEVVSDQYLLKEADGCPNKIGGNPDAVLKIKYFYNELCPYCRQEAPILDRLIGKRGDIFYMQMFDTDKCKGDSINASVTTIPFFVFEANGESNSGGGFVKEDDLENFICKVTGAC